MNLAFPDIGFVARFKLYELRYCGFIFDEQAHAFIVKGETILVSKTQVSGNTAEAIARDDMNAVGHSRCLSAFAKVLPLPVVATAAPA